MLTIVVEIVAFVISFGVVIITVLVLCKSLNRRKSNNEEDEKFEFLSTPINEEFLIQDAVIAYYEQQRKELIEYQKVALEDSKMKINCKESIPTDKKSIDSPSDTPQCIYECTGLASMDNLEVLNPLFSTHTRS